MRRTRLINKLKSSTVNRKSDNLKVHTPSLHDYYNFTLRSLENIHYNAGKLLDALDRYNNNEISLDDIIENIVCKQLEYYKKHNHDQESFISVCDKYNLSHPTPIDISELESICFNKKEKKSMKDEVELRKDITSKYTSDKRGVK